MRQHLAGILREQREQAVLQRGEMDLGAGDLDLPEKARIETFGKSTWKTEPGLAKSLTSKEASPETSAS